MANTEAAAAPRFVIPVIHDNPAGWGPSGPADPISIHPYSPFSKSDKIGKAADWSANQTGYFQQRNQGKYQPFGGANPAFAFTQQDEDDFQLVDNRPIIKPKPFRRPFQKNQNRYFQQQQPQQQQQGNKGGKQYQQQQANKKKQSKWAPNRGFNPNYRQGFEHKMKRDWSAEVKPDWTKKETIDLSVLSSSKVSFQVGEPEDIKLCGTLEYFDKNYDSITTKTEKPLERIERTCYKVTTTDDPVLRQLVMEGAGNVFATDAILSLLMACPRSVYSWDIIVQKVGTKLFFDKRDNSQFDYLTVNETALEPPLEEKDSINTPQALSQEATFINQNFSQQVLIKDGKTKYEFPNPNPFSSGEEVVSVGYKYRRWKLTEDIVLIARCEVDAVLKKDGKDEFVLIKALNEYDPKATGVDWRQKLDVQRAAVLATETKNNSNKLARWTAQAVLAGAEQIKLGYVSRVHPKDPYTHVILGTQSYRPKELATQINLNLNNMWGILKALIDLFRSKPEGKYILMKDPTKASIYVYEVPADSFDEGEADDESKKKDDENEDAEETA